MHKLIALAATSLFAANLAFAQATPATPATPATAAAPAAPAATGCEAKAVSKDGKPLHGAAKAAFLKKCHKDNPEPASGKTAQQDKMKSCNADAKGKKGDERKAFMKECLSK